MVKYSIPVLAGDGIGPEVTEEGKKVVEAVSEILSFEVDWISLPYGAEYYLNTGKLISEDDLKDLSKYAAIYLGALGDPRCPPGILERGILLSLRFYFDEYINLRPIKLYYGVETPLKNKGPLDINFEVVRENTEDMYISLGNKVSKGFHHFDHLLKRQLYNIKFGMDIDSDHDEIAYQLMMISKEGTKRIIKYAFDRCQRQNRTKVTSVDKVNVLTEVYSLWRRIFKEISSHYKDIQTEFTYVDAITMWFIKNPEWFQIVVTPNMFGDIITDLGAMIQGGLGVAAGANINPNGTSMFEPIHGSAPKYRGMNKANPIAAILSSSLMMDHLGEEKAAQVIEEAVKEVLQKGKNKTVDLGGSVTTSDVGTAIAQASRKIASTV